MILIFFGKAGQAELTAAGPYLVCYTAVFSVRQRDDTKNGCVAD